MVKETLYSDRNRTISSLLAIGVVGGLLGGLAAGVLARVAMRLVAVIGEVPTGFTFSGTMFIMILGTVFGVLFGLLFIGLMRIMPWSPRLNGIIYGIAMALVFVLVPFLSNREGELLLVSPAQGIVLFAPIPILFGLIMGVAVEKKGDTAKVAPYGRLTIFLSVLAALFLVLTFMGAETFSGSSPLPSRIVKLSSGLGLSVAQSRDLNNLVTLVVVLIFAGLSLALFFGSPERSMGQWAGLALLLFGAAFFNNGTLFHRAMRSLPLARAFPSLLQTAGLAGLLLLLYLFPDGRFTPGWTKPLALGWTLVAAVWFFKPLPGTILDPSSWPAGLVFVLMMTMLFSGLLAQIMRYAHLKSTRERERLRLALIGSSLSLAGFGLLWATMLMVPELKGRVGPAFPHLAPFALGLYLIPWLPLPLSLLMILRRDAARAVTL